MIQDIAPHKLRNVYRSDIKPEQSDLIFFFDGSNILIKEEETLCIPKWEMIPEPYKQKLKVQFLFYLDDTSCFLIQQEGTERKKDIENNMKEYKYQNIRVLRTMLPMELAYASVTAYHLYQWYQVTRFCSRCATPLVQDNVERMFYCPSCHQQIYPRINPSVIVGVLDKDRILVTKYASARAYRKYALVAGFTEIGETAEETVAREVMEETGLKVKNIRYYKSQPWGFTGGLLLGFWADLDGEAQITLDTEELSEGKWVTREEIELDNAEISLTREMMAVFKEGKEKTR